SLFAYCENNPIMYTDNRGEGLLSMLFQLEASIICYIGMAIGAIFDSEIRTDMNSIKWNPFNADESATMNSNKVSFYKGVPIFRRDDGRSGSFGVILLSKGSDVDTLRHERGHNEQLKMMGLVGYLFGICVPSPLSWGSKGYYRNPQEVTADILGGVSVRSGSYARTPNDESIGWWYLAISTFTGPLAWLFYLFV
ncbi:MAG: hypothetical protein PHX51_07280, partial [Clostridia bacterium]|nr:hypothetical protein [Clostridia bacterium]